MAQSFLIKNGGTVGNNLKTPLNVYDPTTGDLVVHIATDSSDDALLELGAVQLTDKNGELYVNGAPIGGGGGGDVPSTRTIAGIPLSSDIGAQELTNALIYAAGSEDLAYVMGD